MTLKKTEYGSSLVRHLELLSQTANGVVIKIVMMDFSITSAEMASSTVGCYHRSMPGTITWSTSLRSN